MIDTLIIGTGFGGLCMGAKLRDAGRDDFVILEKADGVGGTWRENTYPGAECDIASAFYSYSFWPNPGWDFKWAKQPQILKYLNDFADAFDLRRHIEFGQTVTGATYDNAGFWTVYLADGSSRQCRFLVSAIGQLHHPKTPEVSGHSDYQGASFHSAEWDHSFDMTGKEIAVIGNAASAIQLIPEVAKAAKNLTVYHRSPNWILPKKDRAYTRLETWLGKRFPALGKLYRFSLWCQGEYFIWPMIKGRRVRSWLGEQWCKWGLRQHIKDKDLRAKLTPDFPIGAKRVLLSDKIYPALARDNVDVVTKGVDHFTSDGIETVDGTKRQHDAVIFATGFYSNPFLKSLNVIGEDGLALTDHWADGAQAYMGTMTSGFPNLFILYGPNTNTGHTSIVYKLEHQIALVLQLLDKAGTGAIAVDPEAEAEFNIEMQSRLKKLAWSQVEASWYKVGEKVTNNWPGSSVEYRRRMHTPIWDHFEVKP
ncbi:flavin-containing monooxygenase [Litorimonas sp. RW-G-Af-16]|uniref:flavin-containing monooxygenase n=1 Tax=Litorimonas sp. RW-G-Af-16 TaxID=3241168 RepID=UPI00390C49B0